MDQETLFVCAESSRSSPENERLPLTFCDTAFDEQSLVWSITQDKTRAGPHVAYPHRVHNQL